MTDPTERSVYQAVDLSRADIQGVDYKATFRVMAQKYGEDAEKVYGYLMARAAVIYALDFEDFVGVIPSHVGADIDERNVAIPFRRHPRLGWACIMDAPSVEHVISHKMWCWPVFIVNEFDYIVLEGGFSWMVLDEPNDDPPEAVGKDPLAITRALQEPPAEPWLRRRWIEGTHALDPLRVVLAMNTQRLDLLGGIRPDRPGP